MPCAEIETQGESTSPIRSGLWNDSGYIARRSGAGLGGSILAGALGLQLGCMEGSIPSISANRQGLRPILELVRGRLRTVVADAQLFALLRQDEVGRRSITSDTARQDVAGYAQVDPVGLVSHPLQL